MSPDTALSLLGWDGEPGTPGNSTKRRHQERTVPPLPGRVHKGTDAAYGRAVPSQGKEITMLSTLIIVLLILWVLGLVTSYTLGGLIHILLVVAIAVVLLRVIQGRNPLQG